MDKPTIIFVPGLWEGAAVFVPVARKLQEQGFGTSLATLPSLGHPSPGNPSLDDDIAAVRAFIEPYVKLGRNVVLVCHSVGGGIGPAAIKGLTCKERAAEGLKGGVAVIAFVCAGVFPAGTAPAVLPIFDIQGGSLLCKTPRDLLFNDITDEVEAQKWLDLMMPMPATDHFTEIKHAGWKDAPCHFLICEGDKVVPPPLQEMFAKSCDAVIERCDAGHMVQISQPDTLVRFILKATNPIS